MIRNIILLLLDAKAYTYTDFPTEVFKKQQHHLQAKRLFGTFYKLKSNVFGTIIAGLSSGRDMSTNYLSNTKR